MCHFKTRKNSIIVTGKTDENGKYKTIAIIGKDEIAEVIYIDGDGRGK